MYSKAAPSRLPTKSSHDPCRSSFNQHHHLSADGIRDDKKLHREVTINAPVEEESSPPLQTSRSLSLSVSKESDPGSPTTPPTIMIGAQNLLGSPQTMPAGLRVSSLGRSQPQLHRPQNSLEINSGSGTAFSRSVDCETSSAARRLSPNTFQPARRSNSNYELANLSDVGQETSLEDLINKVLESFGEEGAVVPEGNRLPHMFFLMHSWFIPSDSLVNMLAGIYQRTRLDHAAPPCHCVLPCRHNTKKRRLDLQRRQLSIGYAIRFWIKTFPVQFETDQSLSACMDKFRDEVKEEADSDSLTQLIDISNFNDGRRPSYDWMHKMSVRHKAKRNRKVSLVFKHVDPKELAEQLTYMEYKAIRRISFGEYKNYTLTGKLVENSRLERSIAQFNGLCTWIQCMIISGTTPKERAEYIVKFLRVAEILLTLRNYNTLMAVVGGVSSSAVARLSRTQHAVPSTAHTRIRELTDLLSLTGNYANYRRLLDSLPQSSQCFHLPIIGVHLKDLIAINTAMPDRSETGNINVRKLVMLAKIFEKLTGLHSMAPHIEPNIDLINMLQAVQCLNYADNEIYELSLAREPRTSSTPVKQEVFADWAAGVNVNINSHTLDKHIGCMVEAVFKNYDANGDGFITINEFEEISSNFPFIDSFCVLDTNNDGKISKEEMKTYFKTAANSVMLRSGFKHDFHEHTYFKLTFCQHCTGLLWGVIKQGVKCRICGINSHRHCASHIVMECRTKSDSSSPRCDKSEDMTLASKRRISKRHKPFKERSSQTENSYLSQNNLLIGGGCGSSYSSDYSSMESGAGTYNSPDEEIAALHDRLRLLEENREMLVAENSRLLKELVTSSERSRELEAHVTAIKEHTVSFIIQQMDTLKMASSDGAPAPNRDTDV